MRVDSNQQQRGMRGKRKTRDPNARSACDGTRPFDGQVRTIVSCTWIESESRSLGVTHRPFGNRTGRGRRRETSRPLVQVERRAPPRVPPSIVRDDAFLDRMAQHEGGAHGGALGARLPDVEVWKRSSSGVFYSDHLEARSKRRRSDFQFLRRTDCTCTPGRPAMLMARSMSCVSLSTSMKSTLMADSSGT